MNNIKKTTLAITLFSLLSVGFTGCGSDAEEAVNEALNGNTGNTENTINEILNDNTGGNSTTLPQGSYDCENTYEFFGGTFTSKLSASGKLTCSQLYDNPELEFAEGINEIVVSQLISTSTLDSDLATATFSVNLQEKTSHFIITSSVYGTADCRETYDIDLPLTITSVNELENFDISEYQVVSSTCPDWMNEDHDDDPEPTRATVSEEITITDSTGNISTISSYYNY